MEKLFVYGTLKKSVVQKKVFGGVERGTPDVLKGYRRSSIVIEHEKFPTLIPNKERRVRGLTISVTEKELKLIDKYETRAYRRIKVTLKSRNKAWVYVKAR